MVKKRNLSVPPPTAAPEKLVLFQAPLYVVGRGYSYSENLDFTYPPRIRLTGCGTSSGLLVPSSAPLAPGRLTF